MKSSCLLREVRLVELLPATKARGGMSSASFSAAQRQANRDVVDVRITDGVVTDVAPGLTRIDGESVHQGGGRWVIPGLWDAHTHMGQWAASSTRLDLSGTEGVDDACALVTAHIEAMSTSRASTSNGTTSNGATTVCGIGYRPATWAQQPTVAALDAVSGDVPVVLISGDCHSAWLNSQALRLLGLPEREGTVFEQEWFDVFPYLDERLPGLAETAISGYRAAMIDASSRGITGVVDLEFVRGLEAWPVRVATHGIDRQRIRIGTYADGLEDVIAAGLRTGDAIGDTDGLLTMGPLKIISDGSLNTRTAFCCEPYADADDLPHDRGVQNVDPDELRRLLTLATGHGLDVALHAIGDAAVRDALDAFEATGAQGSIEHAQLMRWEDIPRMAHLGVRASVQPAHLWDDRDVSLQCWPDRQDRSFPLRSLSDHSVTLAMGSDAPVAPLDPWLAIAAAVHRSADDRAPWVPGQALGVAEALAASTDGEGTIGVGSRGDVVLLDRSPYDVPDDSGEASAALREMRAAATILAGRLVHG